MIISLIIVLICLNIISLTTLQRLKENSDRLRYFSEKKQKKDLTVKELEEMLNRHHEKMKKGELYERDNSKNPR